MSIASSPTVIFCVSGKVHVIYATWCLRSLKEFGYNAVQMIVSTGAEKEYFSKRFPDVPCAIINATVGKYPAFSYKPFALTRYLHEHDLNFDCSDIVICDADILWKQDPNPLFSRFSGLCWAHKITAVDPTDFDLPISKVGAENIGIRTILNYQQRYGIEVYPNFLINAGLFMMPKATLPTMLENWMNKIHRLPPSEMLMSEALMSLTYAELGLTPISDDVKYFGRHLQPAPHRTIFPLRKAAPVLDGLFTGYETATHYYGNQRNRLHHDVVMMGLDEERLVREVNARVMVKRVMKFLRQPSRAVHRMFRG